MTLTLTIFNVDRLEDGSPVTFVIDRRDALIGRSPTCDWSLPDPRQFISSRHCQVTFRDGAYTLSDVSTNGTLLNGAAQRMAGPRRIEAGDRFRVGHYEIVAALNDGARAMPAPAAGGWAGAPSNASGWDLPVRAQPAASGWHLPPAAAGWPAPPATPTPTPSASTADWGAAPSAIPPASSMAAGADDDWLSPLRGAPATPWRESQAQPERPAAAPAHDDDPWGKLTDGNAVDWARGSFGAAATDEGLAPAAPAWPPVVSNPAPPSQGWGDNMPTTPPAALPQGGADPGAIVEGFAAAAGLKPGQLKSQGVEVLESAGALLRQLVAGLVVMVEARARAKSQMGAEATSLNLQGNNPIKFARTPEQALAQLLNPQERGFMAAAPAIEDAFRDLQSHQMATLKAMQGALRATLDRFSPTAIRARAESKGLMSRIMPGAREAALWQAYEREFGGVAQGSDEAFMDVFANEFRKAYEQLANPRL